jgi:hypothetical protein
VGSWHHHRLKGKVEIVEDCLTKMLEVELQGWAHGVREAAHGASPCCPHVHFSQTVAHDAILTGHDAATSVYMRYFISNSREREKKKVLGFVHPIQAKVHRGSSWEQL